MMRPSQLYTILLAVVGSSTPTTVATAGERPMRVVVRNLSTTVTVQFGTDPNDLLTSSTSSAYRLATEKEDTFVLAPKQSLYAVALSAGSTQVSVATSEAVVFAA